MLKIDFLSFSYGHKKVIDELSLSISNPGIYSIVGGNGAGKTTFMKLLAGLLKPENGNIQWRYDKSKIFYSPTEALFYPKITAGEWVLLFAKNDKPILKEWNALFELPLDTFIEDLSSGMKQRLKLLSACLLDKKVLLLDEPFNHLDIEFVYLFSRILSQEKKKGKTIILSSHIADPIVDISDQIFIMERGSLHILDCKQQTIKEYFEERALEKVGRISRSS